MDGDRQVTVTDVGLLSSRRGRHGRRGLPLWVIGLALALGGVLVSAIFVAVVWNESSRAGSPVVGEQPSVGKVGLGVPESWPAWGFTHTQYSADKPGADNAARAAISRQPLVQAQSIMGWGADNPEPARDRYDFGSLDRRMDLIRETKGIPVITLCCAPDWMKGGVEGQTDWSRLEVAPDPRYFDEYAQLAAKVAQRYPDVRYYVVWNEFKGFFDETRKRWDAEGYTDLYNKVYTALKAVDRDIKVGGPYIPMNSNSPAAGDPPSAVRGSWGGVDPRALDAVEYWLEHKKGADFIAVDGSAVTEDQGLVPDEFGALGKFSAITAWLRDRGDGLPVWWAEWYTELENSGWSEERSGAVRTAAMMEFARSGAATALYWSPQTDGGAECPGCLWSDTTGRDGDEAAPALRMLHGFAKWFPPGTKLVNVSATPSSVRVLAQRRQMVVVNTGPQPTEATVDGKRLSLDGYEVRWIKR